MLTIGRRTARQPKPFERFSMMSHRILCLAQPVRDHQVPTSTIGVNIAKRMGMFKKWKLVSCFLPCILQYFCLGLSCNNTVISGKYSI
jgi:hypothetical protein